MLLPLFQALLLLTTLPLAHSQQRCQWATLRAATDALLDDLTTPPSTPLTSNPLYSPNLTYTHNGALLPNIHSPPSIFASAPLTLLTTHTILDQDRCAAFGKFIATFNSTSSSQEGGKEKEERVVSRLVGLQAHYSYDPTRSIPTLVEKIDVVSVGKGDGLIQDEVDSEQFEGYVNNEGWRSLSEDEQDGWEGLEGVAGGWLDWLGGGNTSNTTSGGGNDNGSEKGGESEDEIEKRLWGRPCSRLDGGVYTAAAKEGESCVQGAKVQGEGEGKGITERKFLVDDSVGAVSVLARDGSLGGAPCVFEFRIVRGKLKYVHRFAATSGLGEKGGKESV